MNLSSTQDSLRNYLNPQQTKCLTASSEILCSLICGFDWNEASSTSSRMMMITRVVEINFFREEDNEVTQCHLWFCDHKLQCLIWLLHELSSFSPIRLRSLVTLFWWSVIVYNSKWHISYIIISSSTLYEARLRAGVSVSVPSYEQWSLDCSRSHSGHTTSGESCGHNSLVFINTSQRM